MDVGKLLEKASDQVSVRRAFGPAYERDGLLIIPVAIVVEAEAVEARPGPDEPAWPSVPLARPREPTQRIRRPWTPAGGSAGWSCQSVSTS